MRLIIRRDSTITIREHGEADHVLDRHDPMALAASLRAGVEFEAGLTSAQLLRALMPWAALLSRAAWMDFEVWFAETTRAPLRLVEADNAASGSHEPPLDAVVIQPVLSLRREGRRKRGPISLSTRWQTSGRYERPWRDEFGHEHRFCSLSIAPPASWSHLPLIIDPAILVDDIQMLDKALPALPSGEALQLRAEATFFDTIILGFLDDVSFHGAPTDLEQVRDDLEEQVAAIKEGRADVTRFGTLRDLMKEMRAVARADIPAPADAALPSAEQPSTKDAPA